MGLAAGVQEKMVEAPELSSRSSSSRSGNSSSNDGILHVSALVPASTTAASCHEGAQTTASPTDPAPNHRQATGAAVLEELQRQRATIERSRAAAQQTRADIEQSEGILKRMGRWWNL